MQELINITADSCNSVYGIKQAVKPTVETSKYRLKWGFFRPLLAPMVNNRWLVGMATVFGIFQLLLGYVGLPGWQCPIQGALGVICPGCGMTTAMSLLLKGHWQMAVQTHLFAPVVLLTLAMMLIAAVLPTSSLIRFAGRIDRLERRSGIAAILLLGMIIYWLLRVFSFI